ncbi:MAG: 2-hydroxychromene-2-carboxylate isomerase [Magnetovibrio sp.]|nr:2-hydroxychromene-2-carboxylate isomerase [Magnetovibrio sp.]|tara:strand:+ start:463 stop:1107 length:645 start_codon:yes stop_codon:yes gene_type:complete
MERITWYFDFISPYAYLQSTRLFDLSLQAEIEYVPLLFAGLLNHWGQKGPAEIPSKKKFTFHQCIWRAQRDEIPFRTPPQHPFNPLRALRLCIALGNKLEHIQTIFRCIWVEGNLPDNNDGWKAIQKALNVDDADECVADPLIKAALVENGKNAISTGIFGVPSFRVGKEVFWGDDCGDMVKDYIANPGILEHEDIKRIETLKGSAARSQPKFH